MKSRTEVTTVLITMSLLLPACGPGSGNHGSSSGGGGASGGAGNQPPTVAITQPTSGTRFTQGDTIVLVADVADPDGFVSKVDFFEGSSVLATASVVPFQFKWSTAVPGSYSLTAVATDNEGTSAASDPVRVDVFAAAAAGTTPDIPPVVSLTNPSSGATFNEGTAIQLIADAQDGDGTVIQVDFLEGSTILASIGQPPFQFTWLGAGHGTFSLRAVATDNGRTSTASKPVKVVILPKPTVTPNGGTTPQ